MSSYQNYNRGGRGGRGGNHGRKPPQPSFATQSRGNKPSLGDRVETSEGDIAQNQTDLKYLNEKLEEYRRETKADLQRVADHTSRVYKKNKETDQDIRQATGVVCAILLESSALSPTLATYHRGGQDFLSPAAAQQAVLELAGIRSENLRMAETYNWVPASKHDEEKINNASSSKASSSKTAGSKPSTLSPVVARVKDERTIAPPKANSTLNSTEDDFDAFLNDVEPKAKKPKTE